MSRQERIAVLIEHARNPRRKWAMQDADVAMPGGSPECGGSVVVYLKGDGDGGVSDLSWTGEGDTIGMGATSIVIERVLHERLSMDAVLDLDYDGFVEDLGRDVIGNRTRNATMGLSTLKSAVRKYLKDQRADAPKERTVA